MRINPCSFYSIHNSALAGVSFKGGDSTTPKEVIRLPEGEVAQPIASFQPLFNIGSGHAKGIKRALFLTSKGNIPIEANKDGSYTLNKETNTKAYYGKPAFDFLSKTEKYENETQVVFPKGSKGKMIKDGKEIEIGENRAILITKGTKIKIEADRKLNSPYVLTTEKDYEWFERYNENSLKYDEAVYYGSHAYNADFSPNILLDSSLKNNAYLEKLGITINNVDDWNNILYSLNDRIDKLTPNEQANVKFVKKLMDKLWAADLLEKTPGEHIRFKKRYSPKFEEQVLKSAFLNDDEISAIMPIYKQTRSVKMHTKIALRQNASSYEPDLIEKMKEKGLIYNNKKDKAHIYWKKTYGNDWEISQALKKAEFSDEEAKKIKEAWKKENFAVFDLSGLEYIDKDIALYYLDEKINNWTQQKTNWVTDSICASSINGVSPHLGVSLVQWNKPGFQHMTEVRVGEALHKHPNEDKLKQFEVYLITEGKGALRVINDEEEAKKELRGEINENKKGIMILKPGDLIVLEPGVHHCVHSLMGNYEHVCTQVPSVFHYGEQFKIIVPDNYEPKAVTEAAKEMLTKNEQAEG